MAVLKHTKHNKETFFEENDVSELNSYKFPKPRMYNPNNYVSKNEMDSLTRFFGSFFPQSPHSGPNRDVLGPLEFLANFHRVIFSIACPS